MGEAMLKIILVFAELERKMTSERVTATMLSRAASGKWNGGRIPYGFSYDYDTREFSICSEEQKVVLLMCDFYESSHSLLYVSRILNELGHRTKDREFLGAFLGYKNIFTPFVGEGDFNKKPSPWNTRSQMRRGGEGV